jgi:glycerol-3-phosphate acyltransferase PlsY
MTFTDIVYFLALPPLAYALGSIPWGLILTRTFTSVDVRISGSGNIGATNVRRTAGTFLGLLTLTLDILKGYIPTSLAVSLAGTGRIWSDLYVAAVALAAFLGHLYPLYMKGKSGGKGVATAGGCFLAVSPSAVGAAVLGFLLLVVTTRRVSAGSLAAATLLPAALWISTGSGILTAAGFFVAAGIVLRHRENIRRLLAGREPRI